MSNLIGSDIQQEFWMIIPAAGMGRRMGSEIPKQYLSVQGKTLLEWVVQRILSMNAVHRVYIVVDPEDVRIDQLSFRVQSGEQADVEVLKAGGHTRLETVLNALRYLEPEVESYELPPQILVHDAARPCVEKEDISNLMKAAGPNGALLASPIVDTVKRVDDKLGVKATLDRSELWLAQTPQMAPFDTLLMALDHAQSASAAGNPVNTVTDEASALEAIGLAPQVVPGHSHNIKVTYPVDLDWVGFYLTQFSHQGV